MICFMYPGQPLAFDGSLPDDPDFAGLAGLARSRTGIDLFGGEDTAGEVGDQVRLQLYGVVMSLWRCRRLLKEGMSPSLVAEHSMGIYPAIAACGGIDEGDAIEIAFRIGICISSMAARGDYALGCITGLAASALMAIAENNGIYLANYNTSRHFLVSGERSSVEEAVVESLSAGAFTSRSFRCDAPLHTPLMGGVESELRGIVTDYRFRELSLPLMSHIDQDYLAAGELPDFLVDELSLPVYWERTYHALCRSGATRFVEVGAGDALKKYNRWIATEAG